MIDLRTGNCINLALELEDESIDCTVTSPPYNKCGVGGGLFRKIEYAAFDDTLPEDEYQEQQIELLDILFDKTKEGGSLFYNHKVRFLQIPQSVLHLIIVKQQQQLHFRKKPSKAFLLRFS